MTTMTNRDAVAAEIAETCNEWKAKRSEHDSKWEEWENTWRCKYFKRDGDRLSTRSQISIPATKEAIDTAYDHIMSTVFARAKFFELGAAEEYQVKAQILEDYLMYLFQKTKLEERFGLFVRDLCNLGTGVVQISVEEFEESKAVQAETMLGKEIEVVTETIVRPVIYHIPLMSFVVDPEATDIQEGLGCAVYTKKRLNKIRKMGRLGELDKKAVSRLTEKKLSVKGGMDNPEIEIIDFWGWVSEENIKKAGISVETKDGGAECHVIIGDGIALKFVGNPFFTQQRPFLKDNFEEVAGEFYGLGISAVTSGPQKALDATVRARIDNKAIAINQMFAVNVRKMLPGQSLESAPGKAWLFKADPGQAIKDFQMHDVTSGSYIEAQEFERYIQQGAGVSRLLAGHSPKRGEMSATEANAVYVQSKGRLSPILKSIENNVVTEILRWFYHIILEFSDPQEVASVTDPNTKKPVILDPADLVGDYVFRPMGIITVDQENQLSKIMSVLSQSANPMDAQIFQRSFLWKRVYELMNLPEPDKAITPLPAQTVAANAHNVPNVGTQPNVEGNAPQPGPTDIRALLGEVRNG